jgi:hypothetical protein
MNETWVLCEPNVPKRLGSQDEYPDRRSRTTGYALQWSCFVMIVQGAIKYGRRRIQNLLGERRETNYVTFFNRAMDGDEAKEHSVHRSP